MARRIAPTSPPAAAAAGATAGTAPSPLGKKRGQEDANTSPRSILAAARDVEVFERWRGGESVAEIARQLDVGETTIWNRLWKYAAKCRSKISEAVEVIAAREWETTEILLAELRPMIHDKKLPVEARLRANREIVRLLDQRARYRGLYAQPDAPPPSDGPQVNIQVNQQINVGETVREAITTQPDFIEFIRQRAVDADRESGVVCANGERAAVEVDAAPGGPRSGSNGHANGNGRH
jgi:hypothetical protein